MLGPDNYSSKIRVAPPVTSKELRSSTEQERVKPDAQPQSTRNFRKILEKKEHKTPAPEKKRVKTSESSNKLANRQVEEEDGSDIALETQNDTDSESGYAQESDLDNLTPDAEKLAFKDEEPKVEEDSNLEDPESTKDTESIFALKQQSKKQMVGRSHKIVDDKPELAEATENKPKQTPNVVKKDGRVPIAAEEHAGKESPFKVFKKLAKHEGEISTSSKKEGKRSLMTEDKQEPTVGYGQSSQAVDANYANQNRTAFEPATSVAQAGSVIKPPTMSAQDLQALIDKMVKAMSVAQQGDRTDTVITLQNVPNFEEATLTISSTASAPREFNVKFENLTQTAQRLIEENQAALRTSLKESYDIVLHIITATTYKTEPLFTVAQSETSPDKERQDRGSREEQGRQGKDREQKG